MAVKRYACVVADPPWLFGDKLPGPGRGAAKNYQCMTQQQISVFTLPPIADDAWLFLWRVAAMVPEAYQVCQDWGFVAKAEIVWVKTRNHMKPGEPGSPRMGMGHSVRNAHEVCIVAKRGRPERLSASVPSVLHCPKGEHSAKPDAFFDMVEKLAPGPRLEVFGRKSREGWDVIGDEIKTTEPKEPDR